MHAWRADLINLLTPVSSGYKAPPKTFVEILAYTLSGSQSQNFGVQTFARLHIPARQAVIRFRLRFCGVASYSHASGG